jgi:hypothetical protein
MKLRLAFKVKNSTSHRNSTISYVVYLFIIVWRCHTDGAIVNELSIEFRKYKGSEVRKKPFGENSGA